jgi:putative nucleotidyltransferase with HDIG domain
MALLRPRSGHLRAVGGDLHRIVLDTLAESKSAEAEALIGALAEQLRARFGLRWLAFFVAPSAGARAVRVALAAASSASLGRPDPDPIQKAIDPSEIDAAVPTTLDPGTAESTSSQGPSLVAVGWDTYLYAPEADALAACVGTDPRGASALGRLVATLGEPIAHASETAAELLDVRVQRDVLSAVANGKRAVELLLRMALVGFSGERGFIASYDPHTGSRSVLAVHGAIEPRIQALDVQKLAGQWIATVAQPALLAPDAKAVYAVARPVDERVLIFVVASAQGARALGQRTMARVEAAIVAVGRMLEIAEEPGSARSHAAAVLDLLVGVVDAEAGDAVPHHALVAAEAARFAALLGVDQASLAALERAARLHDVGRVAEAIGAATTNVAFQHPHIGSALLEAFSEPMEVCRLVRIHHERADGLGFPAGASPEPDDNVAWSLNAAECVARTARGDIAASRAAWLAGDGRRVLPPAVLARIGVG